MCTHKSNFWIYQNMCLFSCYYYADGCRLFINQSYVYKYIDFRSYQFYKKISSVYIQAFKVYICCFFQNKSNFWIYLFISKLPVFDQNMCLFSCYYYADGCLLLINQSYVYKYIDFRSYHFYKKISPVYIQAFKVYICCFFQNKSNFWIYLFISKLPVFDQNMCLFSCYYYADGCLLLLNQSCVYKYIDFRSYQFYKKISSV